MFPSSVYNSDVIEIERCGMPGRLVILRKLREKITDGSAKCLTEPFEQKPEVRQQHRTVQ